MRSTTTFFFYHFNTIYTAPEDYNAVRSIVSLSINNRVEAISISISDDEEVELNERFVVMIEVISGSVELALRMVQIIIMNDDG